MDLRMGLVLILAFVFVVLHLMSFGLVSLLVMDNIVIGTVY